MGRANTDFPVCPRARARQVVRGGVWPVYQRIYQTLQELARWRGTATVVIDPGDIVRATQKRYPGFNRPLIGEVYDGIDFWQATGRLRRSFGVDDRLNIHILKDGDSDD